MADTVTVQTLRDDRNNYVVKMTNISDGTGETNVKKVDITSLVGYQAGARLSLRRVDWSLDNGYAQLKWEGANTASHKTIVTMSSANPSFDMLDNAAVPNNATGATGSVLLSTTGFTSSSHYTVVAQFRKTGFSSREVTDSGVAS
jgi:hypothetical protein